MPSNLINNSEELVPFTTSKPETLKARMVQFSLSDSFDSCLGEWELVTVFRQDPTSKLSCLCTQGEHKGDQILELNILRNIKTGNKARVGSMCVKQLMRGTTVEADLNLFWPLVSQSRRTISKKIGNRAHQLGILDQYDLDTVNEIGGKRRPNESQQVIIDLIKAKISLHISPPQPIQIQLLCERFAGIKENPTTREKIDLQIKAFKWYSRKYQILENEGLEALNPQDKKYMVLVIYFWYKYGYQSTDEQIELDDSVKEPMFTEKELANVSW